MILNKPVWSSYAIASLCMALSLPAPAANSNFDQGVTFFKAQRYRQAETYFATQVKNNPSDLNSYYYLGLCCQREKDYARARTIFTYLSSQSPDSEAGRRALISLNEINLASPLPASTIASAASPSSTNSVVSSSRTTNSSSQSASMPTQSSSGRRGRYVPSADELAALPAQEDIYFTGSGTQILVAAEINRHPVTLVFDTGAGDVVVGKNQLAEMGLKLDMSERPDARTAGSSNNSVVDVWRVPCEVKVGRIVRRLPISVLDNNQANPLLGQSFFKDFQYKIDYPAHRISFVRKGVQNDVTASTGVPFSWDPEAPDKMLVVININGRNCPCWFDTGNSADGISFGRNTFQKLGFSIPIDAVKAQTYGVTGAGQCSQFRVPYVRFGPIDKTNVLISVHDDDGLGKPLLGQSVYNAYEYSVDNERKLIFFKRRGHGTD
ncbi:MAG: retroviral-like aspartic protease family protein [Candidatus Obscuribacterales bacterium]|nr:retroviral-like aspartic protease family protein [Candidatus Obscuribacterales bacterium]